MNAVLTQRKYRLAGRLANDTARTFGLWWVLTFVLLAIASEVYRRVAGDYEDFAFYALFLITLPVLAAAWVHLHKSYPLAVPNGLTRKEFLTAYAMFGAATVFAAAVLVQLGQFVIDLSSTFRGTEYDTGFYGLTPLESVVRPALWFAVGAAAAAAKLRVPGRLLGSVVGALMVAAVLYRTVGISVALNLTNGAFEEDGTLIQLPFDFSLAPLDVGLAVLFAVITWALLLRAPMQPKAA